MTNETPLDQALTSMVFAPNFEAYQTALREHQDVLLTDGAIEMLDGLISVFGQMGREAETPTMEAHRALLLRCRAVGVDAALEEMAREQGLALSPLDVAIRAFLDAESTAESRRVALQYEALLLSPEAGEWLREQIQYAEQDGDQDLAGFLDEQREILETMRETGVTEFYDMIEQAMALVLELPGRFLTALQGDETEKLALAQEIDAIEEQTSEGDPLRPFYRGLIEVLEGRAPDQDGIDLIAEYEDFWVELAAELADEDE